MMRATSSVLTHDIILAALIEAESLGFDSQTFDEVVDKAIARKKRQDAMYIQRCTLADIGRIFE